MRPCVRLSVCLSVCLSVYSCTAGQGSGMFQNISVQSSGIFRNIIETSGIFQNILEAFWNLPEKHCRNLLNVPEHCPKFWIVAFPSTPWNYVYPRSSTMAPRVFMEWRISGRVQGRSQEGGPGGRGGWSSAPNPEAASSQECCWGLPPRPLLNGV